MIINNIHTAQYVIEVIIVIVGLVFLKGLPVSADQSGGCPVSTPGPCVVVHGSETSNGGRLAMRSKMHENQLLSVG